MSSQDLYEYRPLSAISTIRLIKVCREKVNGCIACRIYHFDEEQRGNVKYHALSYVWGDPTPTRQVYLRDQGTDWQPFPLHENLWQFLDHVWRHKHFGRLFWTDRLCLNQKNREEISQQVPRMRAIYRGADLVVVWLKPDNEEQQGLRKLVRWGRGLRLIPGSWPQRMMTRLSDNSWTQAVKNPYWRRIWIVQEVVVAKKVCVTSGDVSIDFDKLSALLRLRQWDGERTGWGFGPNGVAPTYFPEEERSFWPLFNMRAEGGELPLWKILTSFYGYESSRPVDKVYGLLGMVADHDDGSSPLDNIQVDYDKSSLHVMLDALFESSPPLSWYKDVLLSLGDRGSIRSSSLLAGYIMNSKTSQRHREVAAFALQTLEALDILKSFENIFELDPSHTSLLPERLLSEVGKTQWKPTFAQSAALMGIAFAKRTIGRPEAVRTRRQLRWKGSSSWRCTAHRSQSGSQKSLASKEVVAGTVKLDFWLDGVVEACSEQSRGCDGSTMTFEIPQIGLRLLFETSVGHMGESLTLYRVEEES